MRNAVMPLTDYVNTCDKVREVTGSTDAIKSGEMADKVSEVYDKGRNDEWSDFWKKFTNNGQRTDYQYAFYGTNMEGATIDASLCKPVSTHRIFYNTDMTELPKGIDFSKRDATQAGTGWSGPLGHEFGWSIYLKHIYDIGIQPSASLDNMFNTCRSVETIEILRVKEETTLTGTFNQCSSLKNITFEGVIGQSVSFSYSPLTVESMKSIINALKNYSGTENEGTYTLTLKDTCKTALEADTETVELDGVSYTYFELITAKGWNLA